MRTCLSLSKEIYCRNARCRKNRKNKNTQHASKTSSSCSFSKALFNSIEMRDYNGSSSSSNRDMRRFHAAFLTGLAI